jgi:hypothetical protein
MLTTLIVVVMVVETTGIILGFALAAGYLLNERGREILAHGFTAGMVGVIIAGFEMALQDFAASTEPLIWAYRIGIIIGVFIVIGLVVIMLEVSIEHRPIRLENIGLIDGDYVDAIYDENGRISRGSLIKITSTRGKGFVITGTSFGVGDAKPVGKFDGSGSVAGSDGIAYYYNGYDFLTTLLTHDSGICYYRFLRSKSPDLAFIGGFMAFGLGHSHQVFGRKVLTTEDEEFKRDGGVPFLQKYLKDEAPAIAPLIQKAATTTTSQPP